MSDDKAEFDRYAASYDDAIRRSLPKSQADDPWFAQYKVDLLAGRLSHPPQRVLDFGCGTGRSLPLLRERFPQAELWGYDVSELSLDVSRQMTPSARLTSDPAGLPDEGFDLILAANVFHHIPFAERPAAMDLCARVLSPERGRMFLFEHNPLNPATRWVFERCEFDRGATMLPVAEALRLCTASDLRCVRRDYTLFFPRQLAGLRRFERHLGWLPLGAQYCLEMDSPRRRA